MLSGFLISGILWDSFARGGWWKTFYLRRSLRIFPVYYLALLLAAAIPALMGFSARSLRPLWIYIFYLQNVPALASELSRFPTLLPTGHFWSLAVEEQFYLLWPLLLYTLRCNRERAMRVCVALFAISLVFRIATALSGNNLDWAGTFLIGRMGELVTGAYLALAVRGSRESIERLLRFAPAALAASLAGLMMLLLANGGAHVGDRIMVTGGIALVSVTAAALIACCLRGGVISTIFEMAWLRWMGKISYGVYVYHVLLKHGFEWLTNRIVPVSVSANGRLIVLAAVAAVGTLLVAGLSFYTYERFFLRRKDRISLRSKSRVAPQEPHVVDLVQQTD